MTNLVIAELNTQIGEGEMRRYEDILGPGNLKAAALIDSVSARVSLAHHWRWTWLCKRELEPLEPRLAPGRPAGAWLTPADT